MTDIIEFPIPTKNTTELPAAALPLTGAEVTNLVQDGIDVQVDVVDLAAGAVPDATAATKGRVRLTGHLGGTADSPTVPGLAVIQADVNTRALQSAVNTTTAALQAAVDAKAADNAVVKLTGTQTVGGPKSLTDPLAIPAGDFTTPALKVGGADTGIYRMADGHLAFKAAGALIFHTSGVAGTGLRRNVGDPFIGGRVYIEDELFVEDDFWADEGIAVSHANFPPAATTLSVAASAGANSITVASVPGSWVVDKTIHLVKTPGTQYDRPRISSIVGSVIGLESPLQYAYSIGAAVSENPWRGGVYPTGSWPRPGGIMSVGAAITPAEATVTTQVILMERDHVRYRHGLAGLFSANWVASGGITSAAGGINVSVSAGIFALAGDVVRATAQTVAVAAADISLPRKDIVVYDTNGVVSVVTGTPNASPVAPTPTADQLLLAEIAVAAAATSITSGDITLKLTQPLRLNVVDPANGGYVFGPADDTGVRVRVFSGSLHIVEGIDAGSFSTLDLNPSGGQVTVGGGGLAVAGTFGANGAAAVGKQTLGAAATDAATTQTLANNLRSALIAIGLGQT